MQDKPKLNLFICYSHLDECHVNAFITHIAPLKTNNLINEWYDRKITPGQDYQNTIDNKLDEADIICLFISANFLASQACQTEIKTAKALEKSNGITVVPIIVSPCGWLDVEYISKLLALPTDAKSITEYNNYDLALNNVYEGLKSSISRIIKIKALQLEEEFQSFLSDADLMAKAHSKKTEVFLEDIFVYPELLVKDELGDYEKIENSEKLVSNFGTNTKILIAGEDQSGKTTLCKKIFHDLKNKNFIPVYIDMKKYMNISNLENRIREAITNQYENIIIEEIGKNELVLLIDNFHYSQKREKHIKQLELYQNQILFVDDIFSLNIIAESSIKSYQHYKINSFKPTLRAQLIKKWILLTDDKSKEQNNDNHIYQNLDTAIELVDNILGKAFSSGIMPSYPFFILSVINLNEMLEKPLDQEITSHGYCYQALIYIYLNKQGVKNNEVDTYINFLTEFSFYCFSENKQELSKNEFDQFIMNYSNQYNLTIELDTMIKNLKEIKFIYLDTCCNYSFYYSYLYYFFVAKYLAEHYYENRDIINKIINNLHKNENAYIAIFISHHSNNNDLLDEIILNAMCLYDKYAPATLEKKELLFFDDKLELIIKAAFQKNNLSPENERNKRLANQDIIENKSEVRTQLDQEEDVDDESGKELRRCMKTVEVMGILIKNRAGSLEKHRLEQIFEEAMYVQLRLLSSFFDLIKNEYNQQEYIDWINSILRRIFEENKRKGIYSREPNQEKLEKLSIEVFWNLNFFIIYGFFDKIVHSLGSDKLQPIIEKVCNRINTPSSLIIKHGMLMWYNKNLQIDNMVREIKTNKFSETAKRILKFMIVNHSSMHHIGFGEKSKIQSKLGISSTILLLENRKVPKK